MSYLWDWMEAEPLSFEDKVQFYLKQPPPPMWLHWVCCELYSEQDFDWDDEDIINDDTMS